MIEFALFFGSVLQVADCKSVDVSFWHQLTIFYDLLTGFYGFLLFGKGDNYNRDDLCIIIKLDTCIEYLNWYDGSMSFSDV